MTTKQNLTVILIFVALIFIPIIIFFLPGEIFPYGVVFSLKKYDHIEYNGECYHLAYDDVTIPEEIASSPHMIVNVTLVNKDCKPYDEDKTEEFWLYSNDSDAEFLYYANHGVTYTKKH